MGFNRRKMGDQRREAAEKEAANRRATDAQVLEDAERLVIAWNERQEKRMPMLFSPTIGAAVAVGFWFLWVRCPACQTLNAIDLRTLDRHPDAAVSSLISALSCRSCRPNAPFAELVLLSRNRRRNARGASAARLGRVRRLLEQNLPGHPRAPHHIGAHKASELAAKTIEGLTDKSRPASEHTRAKRRLIHGPKEFRDIRADQPKRKG